MSSQGGAAQPAGQKSNIPQVLAHSPKDNVAVVVVEGLKAGTKALGVVTEDNSTSRSTSRTTSRSGTRSR